MNEKPKPQSSGLSPEAMALTKAVVRSAKGLGLANHDLAAVLGTDDAFIEGFVNEEQCLRPESQEWDAALMLVDLYTGLFSLLGGNEVQIRAWMAGYNRALDAVPLDTIFTIASLGRTRDYVRAAGELS